MTSLPLVFEAPRRGKPPRHLADLTAAERRDAVEALGEKAFRAGQLSHWYFTALEDDPARMTNLPSATREALVRDLLPTLMTPLRHVSADAGATRKTLWKLHDGALVESVLMRYPPHHDASRRGGDPGERAGRNTVCVSSQAGCGMACPFCATGQGGLTRNMSAAEIVDQVVASARMLARSELPGGPGRVSNVVFMGMGEPLANYNAVLGALHRLVGDLGLSQRSITVSTVGLVPAIERLSNEGLNVTLALSLHAPDDELRDTLVPVNTRWNVREALDAAWTYAERTKRRVSIEYALIRDVNDQPWRASLLADLLKGHLVHVNLIPLNETPGSQWTASTRESQREFVRRIEAAGVAVTVRDTRGSDVAAACGQLRADSAGS